MFANQLTRILSYTKDLDIIKKINFLKFHL